MDILTISKPFNISDESVGVLLDSDDFISILTPKGIRKFVNESYSNFLNKHPHELIGRKFTEGLSR